MVSIKRVGRIQPRECVSYFKSNPNTFKELRDGKTIEVPDDVLKQLTGVEEIKKLKKKTSSFEATVEGN